MCYRNEFREWAPEQRWKQAAQFSKAVRISIGMMMGLAAMAVVFAMTWQVMTAMAGQSEVNQQFYGGKS